MDADELRVLHGFGKAVALLCARGGADVVGAGLAEVFPAYIFVAVFPLFAAGPAALVAEKLCLIFLRFGQLCQPGKGFVQAEIRHHIAELCPAQLLCKLLESGQDFCGGRDQIQSRIVCLQVFGQQVGADDDPVLRDARRFELCAEGVALPVGKVLRPEQRIAEGQPGRDAVFPHQR